MIRMGKCGNQLELQHRMCKGDVAFIPARTWHNVMNMGRSSLNLSSVYAPPKHRRGTVHHAKADAEKEED